MLNGSKRKVRIRLTYIVGKEKKRSRVTAEVTLMGKFIFFNFQFTQKSSV